MNIEEIKDNIIKKYGIEPTICFYYYLWNVVDYIGEKRLRESFESIIGQGDQIIAGCYCCTDKTKDIAKEYGFTIVDVEEDKNYNFPESKIKNKVIITTKCNFLIDLNVNVEYPKNYAKIIKEWINLFNIKETMLRFRYQHSPRRRFYGSSTVIYKPYLLEARGYDERTAYAAGSQRYGILLLRDVYKLGIRGKGNDMVHKQHNHVKIPMLHKIYPNTDQSSRRKRIPIVVNALIGYLQKDFYKGVKKVKNSYW